MAKEEFLTIRIDSETKAKLKKMAEKNERTLSSQVIYLIKKTRV